MSHIGKPPCDEGAIRYGCAGAAGPIAARRWTLVAAILGSSMAFVDGTVANVALPAIQRDLGATAAQAQWVIESYALFLAALLLVGGALGDRYGRRALFMVGVGVFTLAALGCALSRSIDQLIVARAIQGTGAALLVPGSLALIGGTFPPAERGAAIGTWSGFSGIAAALGPVLGGFLVDHYSWTWAFLVNVPLGAVLLLLCVAKVPESRAAGAAKLDAGGAVLAVAALGGIVFACIEAPVRGVAAPAVAGAALAGVITLVLFAIVESRSRAPMLPFALFRRGDLAGANLLTLLLYAALGGGLYFLPLALIQVHGYGATAAGAALLPFVAIMFLLSRWAGQLVDRFGPRTPLIAGPLVAAAGFALFALPSTGGAYWRTFLPAVCVLGLGMAVTVAPLTTTVMNAVGTDLAGVASGINNAVSRIGGLLAVAVFGIVMSTVFDGALESHLSATGLAAPLREAVLDQRERLAAIVVPPEAAPAQADAIRSAVGEAFVAGFRRVMLACAGLALLSALGSSLLIGGGRGGSTAAGRQRAAARGPAPR